MADRLPLSALLSEALVAFTIEFDNEFERRTPHRTTSLGPNSGAASGPWLVSMAMWGKFLRFVPDEGITVREFQQRAALTKKETKTWLTRLGEWWGYISVKKNAAEDPFHWMIRPTPGGQKAQEVWRPLTAIIEKRWSERFGEDTIDHLRQSLRRMAEQLSPELPDYLPILGYDMLSAGSDPGRKERTRSANVSAGEYNLPTLLARVLLAFAMLYEGESRLSLAISANVLRLGSERPLVRDLPRLSGVSKEAIAMAVKRMQERDFGRDPYSAGSIERIDGVASGSRIFVPQGFRAIEPPGVIRFGLEETAEAGIE